MFERLADEDFAYLTTTGRRTGRPHRIEIWFALRDGRMYLLSGGGDRADWVRNIRKDGHVHVQVAGRRLSSWARGATPIVIDLDSPTSRHRSRPRTR